jgi:hypothetical protein
MTFHPILTAAERQRRRRIFAKALAPCLGSPRLVSLFQKITVLAVTRPGALVILEALVHGLQVRQPQKAKYADLSKMPEQRSRSGNTLR